MKGFLNTKISQKILSHSLICTRVIARRWEPSMNNILIADDEKDIIKLLRLYLEKDDVTVYEAYDGEMAYMIMKNYEIDLALLDIMMPYMNGFELIKKIRQDSEIPIMIISAKVETSDKIFGFDLGADDYITKPFDPLEVAARVRARLRRINLNELDKSESIAQENDTIRVRNLSLHLAECMLYKDEDAIILTSVEYKILKLFMENPGRVYTKEQIYESGWRESFVVGDNTIRVAISKLRDKVGAENIITIRGLGYRLEK